MIAVELGGWLTASAAGFAAARAWRAAACRMETIARACHELRGPLTAVRLGLDYGAGSGQLTPARLRAIDLELGRAALALDDLEGVRAPRTWWRPPEAVDLEQLVADSVEALRPSAATHGVELRATWSGASTTVWGDRLRLAQVTGNLISNAIEHGGGVVEVRGSVVEARGPLAAMHRAVVESQGPLTAMHGPVGESHGRGGTTRVRVEVTDTGPGLPAPIPELTRRAQGGRGRRGRGLAIAAAIAAEHRGSLAAAPSVRGARLVLELPAGESPVERGGGVGFGGGARSGVGGRDDAGTGASA